jgi:arylsulfatase A-like enzyme
VIPAGVVVKNGLASHVDLAPTILELSGAHPKHAPGLALQGESLRPLWDRSDGGARDGHRAVYAEIRSDVTWRSLNPAMGGASSMVRTADAKFVLQEPDRRSLFLIREDPGETTNVLASHPELARALELALRAWKDRTPPAGEPAASSLDAGTIEQLRKLGYVR